MSPPPISNPIYSEEVVKLPNQNLPELTQQSQIGQIEKANWTNLMEHLSLQSALFKKVLLDLGPML
jgi:hypothetical protein